MQDKYSTLKLMGETAGLSAALGLFGALCFGGIALLFAGAVLTPAVTLAAICGTMCFGVSGGAFLGLHPATQKNRWRATACCCVGAYTTIAIAVGINAIGPHFPPAPKAVFARSAARFGKMGTASAQKSLPAAKPLPDRQVVDQRDPRKLNFNAN